MRNFFSSWGLITNPTAPQAGLIWRALSRVIPLLGINFHTDIYNAASVTLYKQQEDVDMAQRDFRPRTHEQTEDLSSNK